MGEPPGSRAGRAPELARRLPRVLIGIALALPVLLVIGVLVAQQILQREPMAGPDTVRLRVPEVAVPAASSADCARLISGLPREIDTEGGLLPQRVLTVPSPVGTVAWGGREDGDQAVTRPIVLRCGLPRPPELTPSASLLDVDGVEWLQVPGEGESTWVTADRAIYVGLTVPDGVGSAPIQDVSRGVKITLASRSPAG